MEEKWLGNSLSNNGKENLKVPGIFKILNKKNNHNRCLIKLGTIMDIRFAKKKAWILLDLIK